MILVVSEVCFATNELNCSDAWPNITLVTCPIATNLKLQGWTMTSDEMNALRVFERKTNKNVWSHTRRRKVKGKNKHRDTGYITREDNVESTKSLRIRWCGSTERLHNERIPKQIMTAQMEGIRKTGNTTEKNGLLRLKRICR